MVREHNQLSGHKFETNLEVVSDREIWVAAFHRVTKN